MHKLISLLKTNFKWQASIIIGSTLVAYIFLVNNINLWLDEIYSVLMAKDKWSDMWVLLTTEDSKPPLYYIYLKFVLWLFPRTYEIAAAHFGSVILLIVAQFFAATAVRRDYGEKTALWLMILIALLPHSLWLGLEVRTYMLSSLLLLVASVYGVRLLNKPQMQDYVKFGTISILALYSHYYCALWLMFLYGLIFIFLIYKNKEKKVIYKFLTTSSLVAFTFLPWLYILFNTFKSINNVWYVNIDFVNYSWQFFINPLQPEIIQSIFFMGTVLSTSVFTFLLILGLFNTRTLPIKANRIFVIIMMSFILTYALLLFLSFTIRPLVTARYLKIFSLPLYLAAAIIIAHSQNLCKAALFIFLLGFCCTYRDIKDISFDKGYQNAISDIRRNISPNEPLLATDNSNLFCEYFLPEYNCLLIDDGGGEVLRFPSIAKKLSFYDTIPIQSLFTISIYGKPLQADECIQYNSAYRYGQHFTLCRFDKLEILRDILKMTSDNLRKKLK